MDSDAFLLFSQKKKNETKERGLPRSVTGPPLMSKKRVLLCTEDGENEIEMETPSATFGCFVLFCLFDVNVRYTYVQLGDGVVLRGFLLPLPFLTLLNDVNSVVVMKAHTHKKKLFLQKTEITTPFFF